MDNTREIIEGLVRVEEYNEQFRQPNPNGGNPVCTPRLGKPLRLKADGSGYIKPPPKPVICERCGGVIDTENRGPCPAMPRSERWGEDWKGEPENGNNSNPAMP